MIPDISHKRQRAFAFLCHQSFFAFPYGFWNDEHRTFDHFGKYLPDLTMLFWGEKGGLECVFIKPRMLSSLLFFTIISFDFCFPFWEGQDGVSDTISGGLWYKFTFWFCCKAGRQKWLYHDISGLIGRIFRHCKEVVHFLLRFGFLYPRSSHWRRGLISMDSEFGMPTSTRISSFSIYDGQEGQLCISV